MNNVVMSLILLFVFLLGLGIRRELGKKIIWQTDLVLLLQFFGLLLFWCPVFHSYFIGPYLLSMLLSIILILADRKKHISDKLIVSLIVLIPFISLLSNLEHWWWSGYLFYVKVISLAVFWYLLFFNPKKIKNELPYLLLIVFDVILGYGIYFLNYR